MPTLLGTSVGVFIGVTLILFGAVAFRIGQVLASGWRPAWQVVPYLLLLAAANRFIVFALFGGPLLSALGYAVAAAFLIGIAFVGWRATMVRKMVTQYPWLYVRTGVFAYRDKARDERPGLV